MALSITSTYTNKISFTLSDDSGTSSTSLNDSKNLNSSFTYGSGNNNATNGVSVTGVIPSGSVSQIDLYAMPQSTFGSTQNIAFTGVKHFSVYNESTTEGYDFTVQATGSSACTNLFNGGSGNLLVKPYSSFSYNDPYDGFVVSTGQRYVYLADQGSGASYKLFVLGLD